jgi:hypothetical protein
MDHKAAAFSLAVAHRFDLAAVQIDQFSNQGKADPEPARIIFRGTAKGREPNPAGPHRSFLLTSEG